MAGKTCLYVVGQHRNEYRQSIPAGQLLAISLASLNKLDNNLVSSEIWQHSHALNLLFFLLIQIWEACSEQTS